MTIEESILAWMREACKWSRVYTESVIAASEESYTPEQVHNALSRLRRARKIEYVGVRGRGTWRVR